MAPMLFAKAIFAGQPINVFNQGDLMRDFTYIDDIVEGTLRVVEHTPDLNMDGVAYQIYNIGCSSPVKLMDFIQTIEQAIGKTAQKNFLPMQPGDVYQTYADTSRLEKELNYKPCVSLHEGIARFIKWYLSEKNPLK